LKPLRFQKQPYDHVLREAERQRGAFQATAFYILANPVRADLTERMENWPSSSASRRSTCMTATIGNFSGNATPVRARTRSPSPVSHPLRVCHRTKGGRG
jgi:hypothetical protein